MKLEREQIIHTAIALLDEVGIDELTTRKLAQRLGVQQPALYWHFKNKRALLDAMNNAMLAQHHFHARPMPGDDWKSFVLGNARSFRHALLAHRDGGMVHAGANAIPNDLERLEAQARILVNAGFPLDIAAYALVTIGRFVLGGVIDEQADQQEGGELQAGDLDANTAELPLVREALRLYREGGHEASFETGLALIVEGMEVRLRAILKEQTKG